MDPQLASSAPLLCTCGRDVCNSFSSSSPLICGTTSQKGNNGALTKFISSSSKHPLCVNALGDCCCQNHCPRELRDSCGCSHALSALVHQYRHQVDQCPPQQDLVHAILHPHQPPIPNRISPYSASCSPRGEPESGNLRMQGRKRDSTGTTVDPCFSFVHRSRNPWRNGVGRGGERNVRGEASPRQQELQREIDMKKHEYVALSSSFGYSSTASCSASYRVTGGADRSSIQKKNLKAIPFSQKNVGVQVLPQSSELQKDAAACQICSEKRDGNNKVQCNCCKGGKHLFSQEKHTEPSSSYCCSYDCFHCARRASTSDPREHEKGIEAEDPRRNMLKAVKVASRNQGPSQHCCEGIDKNEETHFSPFLEGNQQESWVIIEPSALPFCSSSSMVHQKLPTATDFSSGTISRKETCPGCCGTEMSVIDVECRSPHIEEKLDVSSLRLCSSCGLIWGLAEEKDALKDCKPPTCIGCSGLCLYDRFNFGNTSVTPTSASLSLRFGRRVLVSDVSYLERRAALLRLWERQGKIKKVTGIQSKSTDPNSSILLNSKCFLSPSEVPLSKWKTI